MSDEEDSDNITSVHPVPVNPPAPDEPSSVTIPQLDDVRANLDSATFVQDQPQFGHVMAHIISGVLQQTIPGPISDALAHGGYTEPWHLGALPEDLTLLTTSYDSAGNKLPQRQPLCLRDLVDLADLVKWHDATIFSLGTHMIDTTTWLNFDFEEFARFRFELKRPQPSGIMDEIDRDPDPDPGVSDPSVSFQLPDTSGISHPVPDPTLLQSAISHYSQGGVYGVKKNVRDYPDFKDEKHYDNWLENVTALALVHGVDDVLDPDYNPTSMQDVENFMAAQKFMWAVVISTVKTTMGKSIIRKNKKDAQKVFMELDKHYRQSLQASYNCDDAMEQLEGLDIKKWTGTYVGFLTHFDKKLDVYEDLAADNPNRDVPQLTDPQKEKVVEEGCEECFLFCQPHQSGEYQSC